jgi:tryptophan-rich sensory protein
MTAIASKGQLRMSLLRYALVTVPLVLLLGFLSGQASNSGYENLWFAQLTKPQSMPPAWVFPVAWSTIYVLLGLALALLLHARGARGRGFAIALFVVQLLLNYSWSPIFFAAHQVRLALGVIVVMLLLAAVTALLFLRIRKLAGVLMLPYLAWLCFATWLNYQIMLLNPNAETLVPMESGSDITIEI